MKYFFTILFITLNIHFIQSQCSDLIISEYVEGWSNNKALEIYNPTPSSIDLSYYSISRYTNGEVTASTPLQLEGTIEAYSTIVIGLDKRDPEGTGFDAPMWDGYYTYTDSITGSEVTTYSIESDLQSMINLWANGTYYGGTDPDSAAMYPMTMFFNGNDAITLERIGLGVVDLIGRVGEDPGAGWTDSNGAIWTKDHTLIRKASIVTGEMNPQISFFDPTLEWDSLPANTFVNLGNHDCECNPNNKLIETQNSFVVFPNPTTQSQVTIRNNDYITHLTIYNNLGEIILNQKVDKVRQIPVNLKNNTSGIYLISLTDNSGIKTKSIVVE